MNSEEDIEKKSYTIEIEIERKGKEGSKKTSQFRKFMKYGGTLLFLASFVWALLTDGKPSNLMVFFIVWDILYLVYILLVADEKISETDAGWRSWR
ncbi:MAG: hypothetical protein II951_07925 [Bacteroidales bacterium]|nr:hypothetical protein [Bacteroidales bacterium]